jgi:hypothetical protein
MDIAEQRPVHLQAPLSSCHLERNALQKEQDTPAELERENPDHHADQNEVSASPEQSKHNRNLTESVLGISKII